MITFPTCFWDTRNLKKTCPKGYGCVFFNDSFGCFKFKIIKRLFIITNDKKVVFKNQEIEKGKDTRFSKLNVFEKWILHMCRVS